MKKILGIVVLGFILYLNPINIDSAKADHYKKGMFFINHDVSFIRTKEFDHTYLE